MLYKECENEFVTWSSCDISDKELWHHWGIVMLNMRLINIIMCIPNGRPWKWLVTRRIVDTGQTMINRNDNRNNGRLPLKSFGNSLYSTIVDISRYLSQNIGYKLYEITYLRSPFNLLLYALVKCWYTL